MYRGFIDEVNQKSVRKINGKTDRKNFIHVKNYSFRGLVLIVGGAIDDRIRF